MHFFKYRSGELYAEEVPVKKLAVKYGTPLYIYSYKTLLRHFRAYADAFNDYPHLICFAIKSNSNTSILRFIAKNGGGADIVSGGELHAALKAGIKPEKIVYAGVGKTEDEINFALKSKILMFNVESEAELREINRVAGKVKKKASVALRINPDIDPETHPYITTGLRKHKFGISIEKALEHYRLASRLENINVIGIHKHIGSQITKVSPFVEALKKLLVFVDKLSIQGVEIKYLDIGGGLGIPYKDEEPPVPKDLAKHLIPLLKDRNFTLIIEPGRSIVGNAGILVTKTLYLKKGEEKDFIIVDAGMNDLVRPSFYGAYHNLLPVVRKKRQAVKCDVVGPICESSDFLATDRVINKINQGEYIAVMGAGAYGFSMSSNYNSRPRSAEVLVKGREHFLIRKRETYNDLTRNERIPAFLK
ncbi:MAG: diaminopimelate decarboxylase [Nitrospirae bacterium RBG_13_39_12]|nr:MAG: diaminopimelate decarboxylase [Nitrospirae bacterium RBG_13_39_12]